MSASTKKGSREWLRAGTRAKIQDSILTIQRYRSSSHRAYVGDPFGLCFLYWHYLARKRSAAEGIHLALTHRIGYSDPIVGDSICDHIPEEKHPPIDLRGNDLQLGDWVRVMTVPLSLGTFRTT